MHTIISACNAWVAEFTCISTCADQSISNQHLHDFKPVIENIALEAEAG